MIGNDWLMNRLRWARGFGALLLLAVLVNAGIAQPARLRSPTVSPRGMDLQRPMNGSLHDIPVIRDRKIREFSWQYIDIPQPRRVLVHDIITIIVDEKSEVTLRSGFDRQRTASLKAEVKKFLRLGKTGNLATAAANKPSIDTSITGRIKTAGRVTNQEGIRYRIAATVVDILPNGNIVLEARKSIRTDNDVWQFSLTGLIRSQDVNGNNTALSENIANLKIVKKRDGKVFDSTKRPWGIWLYDLLSPF